MRNHTPDRPADIDPELWAYLTPEEKRETAETGVLAVNEQALRKHIEVSDGEPPFEPADDPDQVRITRTVREEIVVEGAGLENALSEADISSDDIAQSIRGDRDAADR